MTRMEVDISPAAAMSQATIATRAHGVVVSHPLRILLSWRRVWAVSCSRSGHKPHWGRCLFLSSEHRLSEHYTTASLHQDCLRGSSSHLVPPKAPTDLGQGKLATKEVSNCWSNPKRLLGLVA